MLLLDTTVSCHKVGTCYIQNRATHEKKTYLNSYILSSDKSIKINMLKLSTWFKNIKYSVLHTQSLGQIKTR